MLPLASRFLHIVIVRILSELHSYSKREFLADPKRLLEVALSRSEEFKIIHAK